MWSAHNSSSSSSEGSSSGCDMKSSSDMSIPASPRTRTNEATGYSSVRLAGYDTPIGKRNDSAVQCSLGGEAGSDSAHWLLIGQATAQVLQLWCRCNQFLHFPSERPLKWPARCHRELLQGGRTPPGAQP